MNSKIFVKSGNYNFMHHSQFPMIWQTITTFVFLFCRFRDVLKKLENSFGIAETTATKLSSGNYGENRVVNLILRVNVGSWLLVFPDPGPRCRVYLTVVIAEPKGRRKFQPVTVVVHSAIIKIHWTLVPGYGNQSSKISHCPKRDTLRAERF